MRVHQEAAVYLSRLDADTALEYEFTQVGYLYVISGEVEVNGECLLISDAAKVLDAGPVALHATQTSEIILVETVR